MESPPALQSQGLAAPGRLVRDARLQREGTVGLVGVRQVVRPGDGECTVVKVWAPEWREAIETALYEALTI